MSEMVILVRLADPLLHEARNAAERTGLSLEGWIRSVVEDRVRNIHLAENIADAPQSRAMMQSYSGS